MTTETGFYTSSCGHSFHLACTIHWLLYADVQNCPMCRKELTLHEKLPSILHEESELESEPESEEEPPALPEEESEALPEALPEALEEQKYNFELIDVGRTLFILSKNTILRIDDDTDTIDSIDPTDNIIEDLLDQVSRY